MVRATGVDTFRDLDDLRFGEPWRLQITTALDSADVVLVFWSANAAVSTGVAEEVERATSRPDCRVVPVLMDATELSSSLAGLHGVNLKAAAATMTPSELASAAAEIRDGAFPRVESDLMHLRSSLRAFNAVANSDAGQWFGGSEALRGYAYHGLFDRVLLAIWRLTDPQNPNGVPHALVAADQPNAADQLLRYPEIEFVLSGDTQN